MVNWLSNFVNPCDFRLPIHSIKLFFLLSATSPTNLFHPTLSFSPSFFSFAKVTSHPSRFCSYSVSEYTSHRDRDYNAFIGLPLFLILLLGQ